MGIGPAASCLTLEMGDVTLNVDSDPNIWVEQKCLLIAGNEIQVRYVSTWDTASSQFVFQGVFQEINGVLSPFVVPGGAVLCPDQNSEFIERRDLCLVQNGANIGQVVGIYRLDLTSGTVSRTLYEYDRTAAELIELTTLPADTTVQTCICEDCEDDTTVTVQVENKIHQFVQKCQLQAGVKVADVLIVNVLDQDDPTIIESTTRFTVNPDGSLIGYLGSVSEIDDCPDGSVAPSGNDIESFNQCIISNGVKVGEVMTLNVIDSSTGTISSTAHYVIQDGTLTLYAGDLTQIQPCPTVEPDNKIHRFIEKCQIQAGVKVADVLIINVIDEDDPTIVESTTYHQVNTDGSLVPYAGLVSELEDCPVTTAKLTHIEERCVVVSGFATNEILVVSIIDPETGVVETAYNYEIGDNGQVSIFTGDASLIEECPCIELPEDPTLVKQQFTETVCSVINGQVVERLLSVNTPNSSGSYDTEYFSVNNAGQLVAFTGDLSTIQNCGSAIENKLDQLVDSIDELVNGTGLCCSENLQLVKVGVLSGSGVVGDTIDYSFSVSNSGNVTLSGVQVVDAGAVVSGGPITLAPGQTDTATFTGTYTLTSVDQAAGQVINTATVTGETPDGETVTATGTETNSFTATAGQIQLVIGTP